MKTTVKYVKRKDEKLFPHGNHPWRLESRIGMNLAWFQRLDHVEDHIQRYSLKPKDYRLLYFSTGNKKSVEKPVE